MNCRRVGPVTDRVAYSDPYFQEFPEKRIKVPLLRVIKNTDPKVNIHQMETPSDDYEALRYTRVKKSLVVPVPNFAKGFCFALQHDVNPQFFSALVGGDSSDDEMQTEEEARCLIAYLTPRMACKLFWQGMTLCRLLDSELS